MLTPSISNTHALQSAHLMHFPCKFEYFVWHMCSTGAPLPFSHGNQPEAGREIQAELNRRRIINGGMREEDP